MPHDAPLCPIMPYVPLWANGAWGVPLTTRQMHWLSRRQQHTRCNQGYVYCEVRGTTSASSVARNARPRRLSKSVVAGAGALPGQAMPRAQSMHPGDGRERDEPPTNGGSCLQAIVSQMLSSRSISCVTPSHVDPYASSCHATGDQALASLHHCSPVGYRLKQSCFSLDGLTSLGKINAHIRRW